MIYVLGAFFFFLAGWVSASLSKTRNAQTEPKNGAIAKEATPFRPAPPKRIYERGEKPQVIGTPSEPKAMGD